MHCTLSTVITLCMKHCAGPGPNPAVGVGMCFTSSTHGGHAAPEWIMRCQTEQQTFCSFSHCRLILATCCWWLALASDSSLAYAVSKSAFVAFHLNAHFLRLHHNQCTVRSCQCNVLTDWQIVQHCDMYNVTMLFWLHDKHFKAGD